MARRLQAQQVLRYPVRVQVRSARSASESKAPRGTWSRLERRKAPPPARSSSDGRSTGASLRLVLDSHRTPRQARGLGSEARRQWQPETEARPPRAIGAIEHFDSAPVHQCVLARNRKAQARPLDPPARRNLALIERLEY